MTEIRLNTIEELIQRLNELPNNFIYRGHANASWDLESSLERVIGAKWSSDSARLFEEYSLNEFKSKFHLYDRENIKPGSSLAWLALMQHYGVPTRLLDFTTSPYVALYFALEAYDLRSKPDIAVFAFDYTEIMDQSIAAISAKDSGFRETRESAYRRRDEIFEAIVDRFSYDIVWISEPTEMNARIDRQAGSFLVSGNRGMRIADVLSSPAYAKTNLTKFVVDAKLYTAIFALLRKMNINSKSLYGDLNGLARSIRMDLQIYSV